MNTPLLATEDEVLKPEDRSLLSSVLQSWVHESHKLVPETGIGPQFDPRMIGLYGPPLEPR
jgi:hypothetical protein